MDYARLCSEIELMIKKLHGDEKEKFQAMYDAAMKLSGSQHRIKLTYIHSTLTKRNLL